ncbi:elongation factor Ts [Candidatus Dojkabacteria bacterium]|nr:elongation factor Ts [Candidatus Dojkabacteria bacterium]
MKLRKMTSAGMALCKEALTDSDGDFEKARKYIDKRSDVVSRLYNLTGAKIIHCKIAHEKAEGDFEKAVEIIKENGWGGDPSQEKKKEGGLGIYIHGEEQKLVIIVELFCDTDFVAKNEKFKNLAHELAMQVASNGAKYAEPDLVPKAVIEEQKKMIKESDELKGKSDDIIEKITEGKLKKFYEESCLTEQKYFRDEEKTIRNILDDAIANIGEKISLGRIYRIKLGE